MVSIGISNAVSAFIGETLARTGVDSVVGRCRLPVSNPRGKRLELSS